MIRVGAPSGPGALPAPDAQTERQIANAAVLGNAITFAVVVGAINAFPYFLDAIGVEALF